jgi:maleate cis-trans isomerase
MNTALTALMVFGCLVAAVLLGRLIRRLLPQEHLSADSRDVIKLAIGLVATMSALVLGLLVSSAKGSYDTERSEVIQMAAKVAFLDRALAVYGPEAAEARLRFHDVVKEAVQQMWPEEARQPAQLAPDAQAGNVLYGVLQSLSPHDDAQRKLKEQAISVGIDIGQLRTLLVAQGVPSISTPMLIILVSWLAIIFLGFSALAPPNITPMLALIVSAVAVSGAIFLILELDQPFGGVIRISSQPMVNALNQFGK